MFSATLSKDSGLTSCHIADNAARQRHGFRRTLRAAAAELIAAAERERAETAAGERQRLRDELCAAAVATERAGGRGWPATSTTRSATA
jgi:hypothetical protein